MKILLDTNVLLDVFLERKPFCDSSIRVMALVERSKIEGWICSTTVTTIYYLIEKALSRGEAETHTKNLLNIFHIAPVNLYVLQSAITTKFGDYEDGVLHQAALSARVDGIATRNTKDFQHSKLPVYTPNELITAMNTLK